LDGPPYVFTNNLTVLKRRGSAHAHQGRAQPEKTTDARPAGSESCLKGGRCESPALTGGMLSAERRHWRSNSIARSLHLVGN
jgi:hypothetical protein